MTSFNFDETAILVASILRKLDPIFVRLIVKRSQRFLAYRSPCSQFSNDSHFSWTFFPLVISPRDVTMWRKVRDRGEICSLNAIDRCKRYPSWPERLVDLENSPLFRDSETHFPFLTSDISQLLFLERCTSTFYENETQPSNTCDTSLVKP